MNFGSEYTLHDSDDEEETVFEDAPAAGPLSALSPAIGPTANARTRSGGPRPLPPPPPASMPSGIGLIPESVQTRAIPPAVAFLYPNSNLREHIQDIELQKQQYGIGRVGSVQGTKEDSRDKVSTRCELPIKGLSLEHMGQEKRKMRMARPHQPPPLPPAAPPGYPLPNQAEMRLYQQQQQQSRSAYFPSDKDRGEGVSQASPFCLASLWGGGSGAFPIAESTMPPPRQPLNLQNFPDQKCDSNEQTGQGQAGPSLLPPAPAPSPAPAGYSDIEQGGQGKARPSVLSPASEFEPAGRSSSAVLHPARARACTMQDRMRFEGAPRTSRIWTRKVDTNILNIDMAALGDAAPFATGDPTICKGCQACLSAVSILVTARAESQDVDIEGIYDWTCEFCGEVNRAELDDMEKPLEGQGSVDYMLEAAPIAISSANSGKESAGDKDESAVLFVVDTSGSMCVTTPVPGKLTLRGDRTKDLSRLLASGDDRNQLMPGQRRGMTYVSRLQSMQAAICAQLETMAESTPSRHAGLVTFNGEVTLIGDGSGDARVVAGDRLSDAEALRDVGRAYPLYRPVSEARDRLTDRLFALEEGGPTALGPAVVAGLSMLKEKGGRGSRMVVCTDGMANVGLGALDSLKNEQEREDAENFYAELGRESASSGVTVDVVSVDSNACDLENLGTMADVSGGTVTKVKASELSTNFAGILANPILASQVSVRVTLHKGLMFRTTEVPPGATTLVRDIGNVTRETELSFEYQVRRKAERRAMGLRDNGVVSSPGIRPLGSPGPYPPPPPPSPSNTLAAAAPSSSAAATVVTDPQASSSKGAVVGEVTKEGGGATGGDDVDTATAAAGSVTGSDAGKTEGGAGEKNDVAAATAAAAAATEAAAASAYLPFQVQISYTRPDGTKCLRVLTKTQRVTKSKAAAEESMHMAVVAGHAASQAGTLASKGAYHTTRVSMRAWSNLMTRNSRTERSRTQVRRYGTDMAALDTEIAGAQNSETYFLDEDDQGGTVNEAEESRSHGRNRKAARSTNDTLSHLAYHSKTISGKRYH